MKTNMKTKQAWMRWLSSSTASSKSLVQEVAAAWVFRLLGHHHQQQ
jgi:hypothetical protein